MCSTRNKIQPVLLLLFVAGIWIIGAPGQAAAAPLDKPRETKAVEPIPFPDGVLDPERTTAFVSSPKGGIQAIRLEDGKVLWTNDDCPAQPWLAAGNRLIARGERLFVLDTKNEGKLLRDCDVPSYPKVEVPERCTVAFHLWGPRVVGDTLEAKWYGVANIDRSKGRPFNFQAWTAFNKAAPVGTEKVDLVTGKVLVQRDPKSADVTAGLIPEAAKPEQQMSADLPDKLVAVWQQYHKDQNGRVAILGDRMVGVAMTLEPVGKEFLKKITLHTWDIKTGAAAEPVELVKDKALTIFNVVLTEDRRHVGVFSNVSVKDPRRPDVSIPAAALTIFSLNDGKRIGIDLKDVRFPDNVFVDGKRLYYSQSNGTGARQSPNVLKALNLETGALAWVCDLKPKSTIPLPP